MSHSNGQRMDSGPRHHDRRFVEAASIVGRGLELSTRNGSFEVVGHIRWNGRHLRFLGRAFEGWLYKVAGVIPLQSRVYIFCLLRCNLQSFRRPLLPFLSAASLFASASQLSLSSVDGSFSTGQSGYVKGCRWGYYVISARGVDVLWRPFLYAASLFHQLLAVAYVVTGRVSTRVPMGVLNQFGPRFGMP